MSNYLKLGQVFQNNLEKPVKKKNFFENEFLPLIQIKNNSFGILRSRGHNFLFKNVEIFEIRQKFAGIGRFEFGIPSETADFLDFP